LGFYYLPPWWRNCVGYNRLFVEGGWVTGITAQHMAPTAADNSVVNRLEMICVEKYNQDPEKDQKRKIMMEQNAWERGEYIREQGWATMPGENITDRKMSRKCAGIIA
jgi:hypothetical protein